MNPDIKENIRFFKPNDPYYYEVDNLPLIDLLNNDKILRDEINLILTADNNYATESYVNTNLQAAIDAGGATVNVGVNSTTTYTDVISWVNAQGYLTSVTTKLADLEDVDFSVTPTDGNTLEYDGNYPNGKWVPGQASREIVWLDEPIFYFHNMKYGTNPDFPDGHGGTQNGVGITGSQYGSGGHPFENITHAWQDDPFRMYTLLKDYSTTEDNWYFRRSYASMGLPSNTRSVYMATHVGDNAKSSETGDRSTTMMIRNSMSKHTTNDGAGYGYTYDTLEKAYSNTGGAYQENVVTSQREVFMGHLQTTNQEIEIRAYCTTFTIQPHSSSYPNMNIMITGYTTY